MSDIRVDVSGQTDRQTETETEGQKERWTLFSSPFYPIFVQCCETVSKEHSDIAKFFAKIVRFNTHS